MANITVSVDEETLRWARIAAAERGVSVSKYVSKLVYEKAGKARSYEAAKRRSLARRPVQLSEGGAPYPSRDKLHER